MSCAGGERRTAGFHHPLRTPCSMTLPQGMRSDEIRPEHLYKFAGLLFLFALAYRFFAPLTHVLLIGYAAAVLAVGLDAVVRRIPLQRRWTSGLLAMIILAAMIAVLWFGGGMILRQLRGLAAQLPQIEQEMQQWGAWFRAQLGIDVDLVGDRTGNLARNFISRLSGGEILGRAGGLISLLAIPLLIFVGGIFALANPNDRLLLPLLRTVSEDRRPALRRVLALLGKRLQGWIKGLLLSMVTVAVLVTVSLSLLGVPYALLLGVVSGVAEIVPIIGPWVGAVPAVVVAFVDDSTTGLWTIGIMLAIQQVESQLITPLVMSRAAEVHPFVTLFSVLLFGSLFGFLGVLLALPLAILLWTLVAVFWVERALGTEDDRIQPVVAE